MFGIRLTEQVYCTIGRTLGKMLYKGLNRELPDWHVMSLYLPRNSADKVPSISCRQSASRVTSGFSKSRLQGFNGCEVANHPRVGNI
ncbi:hypothetical protein D3C77_436500 [compost metagenome]